MLQTLHIDAEVDDESLVRFRSLLSSCPRLKELHIQDIDYENTLALLQTIRGKLTTLSLPLWNSNFAQYVPALRSLAVHVDLSAFREGATPPAMPKTIRQLALHGDWPGVDEEDCLYNWLQNRTWLPKLRAIKVDDAGLFCDNSPSEAMLELCKQRGIELETKE